MEGVLAGDESGDGTVATRNTLEQQLSQNGKGKLIRARLFAVETAHENRLGSKENESSWKRYTMGKCYRYTILNVQV